MARLKVKVRWSLGGIKLVIYGVNGFFVICHRATTDSSKLDKSRLLGAKERSNPSHAMIWVRNFSKRRYGTTIC